MGPAQDFVRLIFRNPRIFRQRDACNLYEILIPTLGSVTSGLGQGRNARAEGGRQPAFPAGEPRGCGGGEASRGVRSRLISGDRLPPRSSYALQGRAPSHHLWPRNVFPSHITPFHRRFGRYSISGNTAAHLQAALNNQAAWRRGSVPEERCFSKLSRLSTEFFFFFPLPPSPPGSVQPLLHGFSPLKSAFCFQAFKENECHTWRQFSPRLHLSFPLKSTVLHRGK